MSRLSSTRALIPCDTPPSSLWSKNENNGRKRSWGTLLNVATSLWPSVGVKPNTSKVGDLESSGTPECLELDSKAQNTSH